MSNTIDDKKFQLFAQQTVKEIVKYASSSVGPGLNKISEITTNIFCSDDQVASDIAHIKELRINVVLSIGEKASDELLAAYEKKKIKYVQIPMKDDPQQQLGPALIQSYELINAVLASSHRILIHCNSGTSMAPSVIIGYMLRRTYKISYTKYCKMLDAVWNVDHDHNPKDTIQKAKDTVILLEDLVAPLESKLRKVIEFVKQARSCINPNPGFIWQLLMYEQKKIKADLYEDVYDLLESEKKKIKALKKKTKPTSEPDKADVSKSSEENDISEASEESSESSEASDTNAITTHRGYDTIEDLQRLTVSHDNQPVPLEVPDTAVKNHIVIATGDSDDLDAPDDLDDDLEDDNIDDLDDLDF
jgi:hypothetical protein